MEILNIILAVLLIGMSIALIVFVLFQTGGRSNRLSQAISGGSPENYTGKNKQRSKDKQLARVTTILAIIFAVIVIVFTLVVQYQLNKADQPEDTSAVTT
ncbi:MAG: preprotein translocase subunit SecG, partial [Clostridia bacterium]|nr:preprotein translocase subunit SecG [Clostridia bacterium]